MKNCRVCNTELTVENWATSLMKKNSKICKSCHLENGRKWRNENPDKANALARKHYHISPRKHMDSCNKSRVKVRIDMIIEYGGKCSSCGIDDFEVLDIDHIKNNGASHRRNGLFGYNLYRFLKKHRWPKDDYQLLCKNCNWKKELKRRKNLK